MLDIIKINDPLLNKSYIQELLHSQMATMPNIPDLAQTGPKKLHQTQQKSPDPAIDSIPNFDYTFIELFDNVAIREPEFSSNAPIVGLLIVKFRQMWNWMSTRWYVLPIIWQQSDVNMQVAIMLMEMTQLQALPTRHVTDLVAQINSLEEQLSQQKEQ